MGLVDEARKTFATYAYRIKSKRTVFINIVVFLILLPISLFVILRPMKEAVSVQVALVSRGNIESAVKASGMIDALEKEVLSARVDGIISELRVDEGKVVERGEILCVINNPEVQKKLYLAKVDIEQASWDLRAAKSRRQIIAARRRLDIAKREVIYLKNLIKTMPRLKGTVVKMMARHSLKVTPGMFLFEVADMNKIIFRGRVGELDVTKVKIGQGVEISVTMIEEKKFRGIVEKIELFIDKEFNTTFMEIQCKISDFDKSLARLGAFAEAEIVVEEKNNILRIPLSAVIVKDDVKKVFVVQGNKVFSRVIKVGIKGDDYVGVISGLEEGDLIVTIGNFELKDGDEIEIEK